MFQNNLHADKYKNNTAGQFRPGTEPVPENRADFYTQERQKESNCSYKRHRKQNISLKKTERDANGQSVNAVATASTSMVLAAKEQSVLLSLSKDSTIILPPMKTSKPKATQWSTPAIRE